MLKKLAVIMVVYLMMITGASINVSALNSNGFTYTLDNDEATITNYGSTEENIDTLKVPSQIDGHKVVRIDSDFRAVLLNSGGVSNVNSLILPDTITDIALPSDYSLFEGINSIIFENTNDNFYMDNGCLYSKDKANLYFIPTGLRSLEIPAETKNVNLINLKNTQLTSFIIPSNVERYYPYGNFGGSLHLPDSLNTLEINTDYPFKNDNYHFHIVSNYLSKLSYGENVKDLSGFSLDCKNLSELNFSENLIKMPCTIDSEKLKKVYIPKNVEELNCFYENNLESFEVDPNNKTFKSIDGVLFKGDMLYRYPKAINNERYEVPEGTTRIAEIGNKYLKELKLPSTIENVDDMTYCVNLESLNIPEKMDDTYPRLDALLSNCYKLKNVIIDPNNKNFILENGAIYSKDYSELYKYLDNNEKTFSINEKTSTIGDYAFANNESIENVDTKNVTDICYFAFINCPKLNKIILENIKELGGYVFKGCTSLKNVELPECLEDLGWNSNFRGCTKLESINIPSKISYLNEDDLIYYELADCYNLTNITVSKDNKYYMIDNNVLYRKKDGNDYGTLVRQLDRSITSFKVKDNTTSISGQAFYGCDYLKNVNLNNVKEIDVSAFEGCKNLKYVVLPKSVTYVKAFCNKSIDCKLYVYPGSKAIDSIESWNNQYHRYLDYPKIDYTIISSFVDDSSNVEVCLDSQKNDSDSVLKVQQLTSGNSYDKVAKYSDNFNLYDISFYKDNEKVNIDGSAIVKIPVKEGMDGNKCKVYYNDNGKFTDMNAVYKDGYMEFETTHFSEYVLVEGSLPTLTMGDVNGDGKVNVLDAVMVLRHDANIIKLDDSQLKAADVNEDGKVDVLDAVMILRYEAGIIKNFKG